MKTLVWKDKLISYQKHFKNDNEEDLQQMYLLLKNGYSLKEIATLLPNYAMSKETVLNHPYAMKYRFLFDIIGMIQFLSFILKQNKFQMKMKEIVRKTLTYPSFLLLMALAISYFFLTYLIPQILRSLSEFQIETQLSVLIHTIELIQIIFYMVLILFALFYLCTRNKQLQILIYTYTYSHFSKNIIFDWISLNFANLLLLLYQSSLPIQECIKAIHALRQQYIISTLSYRMKAQLEEGIPLKSVIMDAIITQELKAYLLIAIESGDFLSVLHDYVQLKQMSFEARINKLAKTFQFIAYTYISLLLVIMYQVIFLPMQFINNI